jgi:hypothetical protein
LPKVIQQDFARDRIIAAIARESKLAIGHRLIWIAEAWADAAAIAPNIIAGALRYIERIQDSRLAHLLRRDRRAAQLTVNALLDERAPTGSVERGRRLSATEQAKERGIVRH